MTDYLADTIIIVPIVMTFFLCWEVLKRMKVLQLAQARRSMHSAFLEAELRALRVELGQLHNDEDFAERVEVLRDQYMRNWLENDFGGHHSFLAIGLPDPDEDPVFYQSDFATNMTGDPNPELLLWKERLERDFAADE